MTILIWERRGTLPTVVTIGDPCLQYRFDGQAVQVYTGTYHNGIFWANSFLGLLSLAEARERITIPAQWVV